MAQSARRTRSSRAAIFFCLLAVSAACAGVASGSPAGDGALSAQSTGETIIVDGDSDADYETIQAAIDAASDGDTIRVRAGEYEGFTVSKDIQILTAGAAVDGDIRIRGDAAPTIEGVTLRGGVVDAKKTGGNWALRDVAVPKVAADNSTGAWLIADSDVGEHVATDTDVKLPGLRLSRTAGDWRVRNSTVVGGMFAFKSSGDWTVRGSVVRSTDGRNAIYAGFTTGNWTVTESRVSIDGERENQYAIVSNNFGSGMGMRITNTAVFGGIAIRYDNNGSGLIRNSYITPNPSGRAIAGSYDLSSPEQTSIQITENTILGVAVVTGNRRGLEPSDFPRNYWGQPGGPREGQCRGVNCPDPLRRSPVDIPEPPENSDLPSREGLTNRPPTAVIGTDRPTDGANVSVVSGTELTFDGSNSADPDGQIESYEWTVRGSETGSGEGPQFDFSFTDPGRYRVSLTVDDGTATDTTELVVLVDEAGDDTPGDTPPPDTLPPVAALASPEETAEAGDTVTLSAAQSQDLDSGVLAGYRWDLDGDGTIEQETAGPTVSATYDQPGVYEPTVTVIDPDGATDQATTTVDVVESGATPTTQLTAEPNEDGTFVAGPPITFDAGGSTAPDGDIVAYEWEFGDGTTRRVDTGTGGGRIGPDGQRRTAASPQTRYSYDRPGTYTVSVTVIDDQGRRAQASRQITIEAADSVQVGEVDSTIPGPMIAGAGITNEYSVTITGEEPIEEVVFEFPNGETVAGFQVERLRAPNTWFVDVDIDAVTRPGTNVVEVRATDESGRTGVGTFAIDVFDPPGWFDFAMGEDPTVERADGQWVLRADPPTVPRDGLLGPNFELNVPVSQISGDYDFGVGANYGFEYVFADREATATGGGQVSVSGPLPAFDLDLDADVGTDFGGGRSRGYSLDIEGTARVTPSGDRVLFEQGRVAIGTETSVTVPLAGVAVYVPKADVTIGVASVDLTLTDTIEPAATLTVNDARTALVPSSFELTQSFDVQVTAGVGTSIDVGFTRAGVEARGIAGGGATVTTELYPQLATDQVTLGLRAGVRGCLGPCGTEWLLNDEYELVAEDD